MLTTALESPIVLTTGAWLLHFAWQGTLVAGLLALVLRVLRHEPASTRYTACWMALFVMLVLPTLTVITTLDAARHLPAEIVFSSGTQTATSDAVSQSAQESTTHQTQEAAPHSVGTLVLLSILQHRGHLVFLWGLGIVILGLRMSLGLYKTRLLITYASDLDVSAHLQFLCSRLKISKVIAVKSSTLIDQPLLIGWLKPVILIPASLVTGMPPAQLRTILAHELAHIRRHDYFFSLVQSTLETLFFFHPAIWWISNRISIEREYCCDALAVQTLGRKRTYLQTLAALETYRANRFAPSMSLSMQDGSLLDRVERIISLPSTTITSIKTRIISMTLTMLLLMSVFAIAGTDVNSTPLQEATVNRATPVVSDVIESTEPVNDIPSLHPLNIKTKIVSGFGMRYHPILKIKRMHAGVDFIVPTGTPVYATASGTVVSVGTNSTAGMFIEINHGEGYLTKYRHLSQHNIEEGAEVKRGEKIGESGNTGQSQRPHLHYEVILNDKPVDPVDYLPADMISAVDEHFHHPLGDITAKVYSNFGMRHHPVLKIDRMHKGIDFPTEQGVHVRASQIGTVTLVESNTGWGQHIKIEHNNGIETHYAHLSEMLVEVGDHVEAGQVIGKTGNTGLSTKPHLHFGMSREGEWVDPMDYLPPILSASRSESSESLD